MWSPAVEDRLPQSIVTGHSKVRYPARQEERQYDGAAEAEAAVNDPTPLAVTGGGLIVAGVLIGLLLRWLFGAGHRQMRSILRGPGVAAQVVGVVEREGEEDPIHGGGGGGGGFAPIVSFRTVDGVPVTASGQYVFAGNRRRVPALGTTMRVCYDPRDPRQIYIRGWDAGARVSSVFIAVGPLLVLLGMLMVVSAFVTG